MPLPADQAHTSSEHPPLPEWVVYLIGDTTALQLVFWVVAIITLVTLVVKLWPIFSRGVHIIDSVSGLPDFIKRTDASIERLREQVENDHETNLRDEVTAILDRTVRVEDGVAGLHEKVAELAKADDELRAADQDLRDEFEHTHPKEHP